MLDTIKEHRIPCHVIAADCDRAVSSQLFPLRILHSIKPSCIQPNGHVEQNIRIMKDYLGYRNIQLTVRYTATNPGPDREAAAAKADRQTGGARATRCACLPNVASGLQ